MNMIKLEEVFGVSSKHILSYIGRHTVDGAFESALRSDKQIIVYGASKQGKTALVSKYLPYDKNIAVSCSPKSQVKDIYKTILRKLDIEIITDKQKSKAATVEGGAVAKIKTKIPFLASGAIEASAKAGGSIEENANYKSIEFNLELPQDISDLYVKTGSKQVIILENFHYLPDDVQKQLAFDLRTFQELGIRFIILGVWKEKNRLIQFNGDLQDRIAEIPVEPWDTTEFICVAKKGAIELNIEFSNEIIDKICKESLGSIGVVQELLKTLCLVNGVTNKQRIIKTIDDISTLNKAIQIKCNDYSSRHVRALEDISKGRRENKTSGKKLPLYLPYYFVMAVLSIDFTLTLKGIQRKNIEDIIIENHYKKENVRPSDFGYLLTSLSDLQASKKIAPPIFDYDRSLRTVNIVDSTFFFFLKNCNKEEIKENIESPID